MKKSTLKEENKALKRENKILRRELQILRNNFILVPAPMATPVNAPPPGWVSPPKHIANCWN